MPSHANARCEICSTESVRSDRMTPALGGVQRAGCPDGWATGTGWVVEAGEVEETDGQRGSIEGMVQGVTGEGVWCVDDRFALL